MFRSIPKITGRRLLVVFWLLLCFEEHHNPKYLVLEIKLQCRKDGKSRFHFVLLSRATSRRNRPESYRTSVGRYYS